MSTAYDIIMMETLGITQEQAASLLDSGLPMYRNFRRYLELKSKGTEFRRIKFPRYMADEMTVVKSKLARHMP